jgi:hypothetical protein
MNNGNPFNFPDLANAAGCGTLVNPGNPAHYIKTECFTAPPLGRLGNAGRNSAIGPGLMNMDLLLVKTNKISKDANIQLRFEVFNLLNRANFSVPDRTVSQLYNASFVANSRAGVLTGTSTPSRQLQAAVKVTW